MMWCKRRRRIRVVARGRIRGGRSRTRRRGPDTRGGRREIIKGRGTRSRIGQSGEETGVLTARGCPRGRLTRRWIDVDRRIGRWLQWRARQQQQRTNERFSRKGCSRSFAACSSVSRSVIAIGSTIPRGITRYHLAVNFTLRGRHSTDTCRPAGRPLIRTVCDNNNNNNNNNITAKCPQEVVLTVCPGHHF